MARVDLDLRAAVFNCAAFTLTYSALILLIYTLPRAQKSAKRAVVKISH